MAESFLREGTQKIVGGQPLTYGQSITDPCLGWEAVSYTHLTLPTSDLV